MSGCATAVGAPIIADAANPGPIAAKSEVMVRDFVGRIARLFSTVGERQCSRRTCVLPGPLAVVNQRRSPFDRRGISGNCPTARRFENFRRSSVRHGRLNSATRATGRGRHAACARGLGLGQGGGMACFRPPPVSEVRLPSPPERRPRYVPIALGCNAFGWIAPDCVRCRRMQQPGEHAASGAGECGRMRIMDEQRGRYSELSAPERDRRIAFLRGRGWTYKKIGARWACQRAACGGRATASATAASGRA